MAKTKIDWADKVWNPVTGCTKISEGCKNCYAERMHTRLEKIKNSGYCDGESHFSVRLHPYRLSEPLEWKKPQRVFVCSMGDLFHEDVLEEFLDKVFTIMALLPQHTFLILTKRPKKMLNWHMRKALVGSSKELVAATKGKWPLPNVYLGVTVEKQQAADERIPILTQIPAAKRFVSVEPLLSPVILNGWMPSKGCVGGVWIDWVILGGETGPKARPMHPDWVRSVRDQCQAAGVPFFFKQWGEWAFNDGNMKGIAQDEYVWDDGCSESGRVGKKAAGHLLDGKEYREWPE